MIEYLKYIFLGVVQGVSEILPISSSGHTALFQKLVGLNLTDTNMALLSVFMHFASLIAMIIFFHKQIWYMLENTWLFLFTKTKENRSNYRDGFLLFIYLVIASIPVALVGILLEDHVTSLFGSLLMIGIFFIITGLTLLFVGLFTKKSEKTEYTWRNTLITGLFQCFGILPGISRSGITMSGAKVAGLNDEKAKQFAFLLFLPVAAGSFIFSIPDLFRITSEQAALIPYFLVATLFSFGFTLLALLFIFKKFNLKHYKWFAIYMFMVGTFTIIYSLI
ncbi:MAG: undecaprenyl-diphosphate phosphatase [Bacilli bacterium]|jgi:undecaprenyl-diphosphatase|nr:undecaprenyl-diphosphate phosphatase [Bacilli bacterium]